MNHLDSGLLAAAFVCLSGHQADAELLKGGPYFVERFKIVLSLDALSSEANSWAQKACEQGQDKFSFEIKNTINKPSLLSGKEIWLAARSFEPRPFQFAKTSLRGADNLRTSRLRTPS